MFHFKKHFSVIAVSFFFICIQTSCKQENAISSEKSDSVMTFNKEKWLIKEGKDYVYRKNMLEDVVYNDTIRSLSKEELLTLLGSPDKENENFYYYTISQKRLGFWPLHTTTMVIKLKDDTHIDWIKIHK